MSRISANSLIPYFPATKSWVVYSFLTFDPIFQVIKVQVNFPKNHNFCNQFATSLQPNCNFTLIPFLAIFDPFSPRKGFQSCLRIWVLRKPRITSRIGVEVRNPHEIVSLDPIQHVRNEKRVISTTTSI
jgi:hypothetical protein